jgi:acyl-CoA synthetase (AMP-forming)/AMP-acid ligase II
LETDELKDFLSNKLAAFKIPLYIKIETMPLPKVGSGKFDKPALRKEFVTFLKQDT